MKCEVKIFVSGDFCPSGSTEPLSIQKVESVFGDVLSFIRESDLSITNLECPLTLSCDAIEKIGPNLKANPNTAAFLKNAGFGLVTLANNHIYDYGQVGIRDTLDALQQAELSYVGAGLTLKDVQQTFFTEVKGIKLAIVNFAEVEFSCANSEHGGANPMDLVDNIHQIQNARNNADQVLVIVHGGHEYYHYPSPATLKRYRFYAENGASAVIAHHTHCVGGYENWKGIPIFYSLGNFLFPASKKMPDLWYEGYALLLKISKESISFEILPYEQCKNGSLSICCKCSNEVLKKIEDISHVINNESQLLENWGKFIEDNRYYLELLSGFGRYKIAFLRRLGLMKYFYKRSHLNMIIQVTRCEAHREVAKYVLSNYLK